MKTKRIRLYNMSRDFTRFGITKAVTFWPSLHYQQLATGDRAIHLVWLTWMLSFRVNRHPTFKLNFEYDDNETEP